MFNIFDSNSNGFTIYDNGEKLKLDIPAEDILTVEKASHPDDDEVECAGFYQIGGQISASFFCEHFDDIVRRVKAASPVPRITLLRVMGDNRDPVLFRAGDIKGMREIIVDQEEKKRATQLSIDFGQGVSLVLVADTPDEIKGYASAAMQECQKRMQPPAPPHERDHPSKPKTSKKPGRLIRPRK
jgi:hypothetical protein